MSVTDDGRVPDLITLSPKIKAKFGKFDTSSIVGGLLAIIGLPLIFAILTYMHPVLWHITGADVVQAPPNTGTDSPAEYCRLDEGSFLNDLNKLRASKGLSPLTENTTLDKVADMRKQDMYKYHYYGHVNPYTHRDAGYFIKSLTGFSRWGENLDGPAVAVGAFDDFVKSPEHYQTMMYPNLTSMGLSSSFVAGDVPAYGLNGQPTGSDGSNYCLIILEVAY